MMKLGKYNRIIRKFAFYKHFNVHQVKMLIALSETMWAGIDELQDDIVAAKHSVTTGLKDLKDRDYIKLARPANGFKKIKRKYCITEKGREVVQQFINLLNY